MFQVTFYHPSVESSRVVIGRLDPVLPVEQEPGMGTKDIPIWPQQEREVPTGIYSNNSSPQLRTKLIITTTVEHRLVENPKIRISSVMQTLHTVPNIPYIY